MPENEVDTIAEFGAAIERFHAAWLAYADAINPERKDKETKLDKRVEERLSYYNDPANPRHPKVSKVANEIRAEMLLFDFFWKVTGPEHVIAARKAVDERLQTMTDELRRVLEAIRALPAPTIETFAQTHAAWTAIRPNAEQKLAVAATQGIVLAHAFAALLEASVDAIDLRTNALEHYDAGTPLRANTIIKAARESLTEVTASEVAQHVLKEILHVAAAPAAAIVDFATVVYSVHGRVGKIPEYYKAGDVDELHYLGDGLNAAQKLASALVEALDKLPSS